MRKIFVVIFILMLLPIYNGHANWEYISMPNATITTKTVCIEGTVWLVSTMRTHYDGVISHDMEQVFTKKSEMNSMPATPVKCSTKQEK